MGKSKHDPSSAERLGRFQLEILTESDRDVVALIAIGQTCPIFPTRSVEYGSQEIAHV
jgi:hypothetical protein